MIIEDHGGVPVLYVKLPEGFFQQKMKFHFQSMDWFSREKLLV